MRYLILLW